MGRKDDGCLPSSLFPVSNIFNIILYARSRVMAKSEIKSTSVLVLGHTVKIHPYLCHMASSYNGEVDLQI